MTLKITLLVMTDQTCAAYTHFLRRLFLAIRRNMTWVINTLKYIMYRNAAKGMKTERQP